MSSLARFVSKNNFSYFDKKALAYYDAPGANPSIAIYNASAVKIYNATGSLARFVSENIFTYSEKRSSLLRRWRCCCKFLKS
jgi:hypothetical protein